MQMCKINEFNNELYVIKVAWIMQTVFFKASDVIQL